MQKQLGAFGILVFLSVIIAFSQAQPPTSQPASQSSSKPVTAEDIVFVIQGGGPELKNMKDKKNQLKAILESLGSNQKFHVIFFFDDKKNETGVSHLIEGPANAFAPVTKENIQKIEKLVKDDIIDNYNKDTANPIPATDKALALLKTSKCEKKIVFIVGKYTMMTLLNSRETTTSQILSKIAERAKTAGVKIDTLQVPARLGGESKDLEKYLSQPTGGVLLQIKKIPE